MSEPNTPAQVLETSTGSFKLQDYRLREDDRVCSSAGQDVRAERSRTDYRLP
jgi:hypothetical protein